MKKAWYDYLSIFRFKNSLEKGHVLFCASFHMPRDINAFFLKNYIGNLFTAVH